MNNTVIEQHSVDVRSITNQEDDWLLNEKQQSEGTPEKRLSYPGLRKTEEMT